MAFLSEAQLEAALLEQIAGFGYACVPDDLIGPDGRQPERNACDETILKVRLAYPPDLQDAAVQTVLQQAEALSAA